MLISKPRSGTFALLFILSFFVLAPDAFAQTPCVAPPSGMVHWWTADNNTFDIVGGQHGILRGDATYGDGQVIGAFDLDGAGDYVEVPNDPSAAYNFTGSFTVDAWIYVDEYGPEFSPIVSKWNDLGVNQRTWFLSIDHDLTGQQRLRFDVSRNGFFGEPDDSHIVLSEPVIPTGQWVHVAGVYNNTTVPATMRVYINGVAVPYFVSDTPVPQTVFVNNEPLLIGAGDLGANSRDFFNGRIDEVELFGRALTLAEIQSIYTAGSNGKIAMVTIDVKPGNGDEVDPINFGSKGKTPVAVLSTETFDATTMDIASINFAGASVAVKNDGSRHYSYEDVNGDERLDLVLHFNTRDLSNLNASSTEAVLTGTTIEGRCITASDSIRIVPAS